ncbi:toxin glutamine deamidase domain-containing protein [Streptomyces decoyicus]|uniref:toxin glutamine deamidase domain-containing protein n=1 Tax=Streptomyces decoyicus TaxID=249567 RepID=UPI0033F2D8DC
MSLMLPDWLEWVLEMLGYDWPTGDEDKMNESADRWREFANAVEQLQSEGVSAAGTVLSANSGDSIDGFSRTWEKFSGNGSGYLDDARTAAELIAFALNAGSGVIIGMKVAVIAQLAILAAEIIAAQAAAPFTLGLSEIGAAGATQATRLIVRRILKEAREALVEAIVETVKEPAVSALEAMISDAIAQGMNMNFGAQQGFDVGRSAKTGAEAGVEALKNSGQTFAESLRDGAGGRAGHHARGGLESAAGHGGGENSGGSSDGSSDGGGSESASGSSSSSGGGSTDGGGSGSGASSGNGSGTGNGSSTGNGSGSGGDSSSGSDSSGSSGGGSGSSSGSGGSSGGSGTGAGSGAGSGSGPGGASHSPRPGDTPTATDTAAGTGASTHPATSSDGSPSGQDGGRTPQAQPLPPPDQRSPFDAGYQGGSDSPYGSSPTPDSGTTPDSSRPAPDSVSTQPAPDHTPDAGRPDHPDQVSTQPAPDNTPDAARPGPDPVSTQPAPDHTPDSARPHPDTLSTQPAPGPSPHPDAAPTPGAGPGPNHPSPTPDQPSPGPSSSPSPDAPSHPDAGPAPSQQPTASPDPVAGNPPSHGDTPTDTNATGDGTSNSNSGDNTGSGRGATPHVNVPSQGAPVQHAPSSGPPIGQRDPSPGDPMPTVDDNDDTTVRTQSADTIAAPAQRTADPGTSAPTTPQQSPQHTPQAAGPMMAPPTTVPQQGGPATPNTAPPRGTTPPGGNPPTPSNRRPDGSQVIRDVTQQPSPERPAYNPRLDGPRPDRASPRANDPRTPGNERPDPRQQRPTDPRQQQPQPQPQPQNSRPDPRQPHPTGENPTPNSPSNAPPNGRPENDGPQNSHPDQPSDHAHPADRSDRSDQHAPAPASETRNRERPGGLDGPTDEHQQHVENSIPRDENGEPQRHPDPHDGNWLHSLNDPGPDAPGRNNNCVDAALATADTYAGNPTAAAHRTPDTHPDGTPSDRGENNGRDRIENTLGTHFHDYGNGNNAFHRLENDLRNTGHGSQAVIITQDRNGRAHAWNVVNHHGKITYLDAQTGQRSNKPLHDGTNGVHAIPLDPNRRPLPTNPTNPAHNNQDTESNRRPAAEPAGAGEKRKHPGEARDIERDDQRHPVHGERPGTHQDGLPPDDAQDRLRANEQTPVHQIQHDVLDQQMRQWANDGSLARVLQIAAGHGPDPDGPRRLNSDQLAHHLKGFQDLNRGERMAVVASLGRLSHTFHKEYGVHSNPVNDGKESVGASLHQRNVDRNLSGLLKGVNPQGPHAASHGPDLTGRNFAVIEIEGPNGTEYVVDSSHPKEGDTKKMHSEENLGNWLKEANKVSGNKYTLSALYTEREPCGNKKGALGKHNCSDYLIKMAKEQGKGHDVPVYYSTSYRTDADVVQERSKARQELMKQAREALGVKKLPRETLKQIDDAVHQRVPDSPAMAAQERQFEDRVDRVRNLWSTIATQV